MYRKNFKIIIFFLVYNIFFSINFLAAQEEKLSKPVESSKEVEADTKKDEKADVDVPGKKAGTEDITDKDADNGSAKKTGSPKKVVLKPDVTDDANEKQIEKKNPSVLKDLVLLDSDLSKIKISRIPGIEKSQDLLKINKSKSEEIDKKNKKINVSDVDKKKQDSSNQGFIKVNKEKGKWQAIIIVFSLIFILIFYKLKTKNKRKRIFRRMPKR